MKSGYEGTTLRKIIQYGDWIEQQWMAIDEDINNRRFWQRYPNNRDIARGKALIEALTEFNNIFVRDQPSTESGGE